MVTVTDVNGCTSIGEHDLSIATLPEPSIQPPAASCGGNPVELFVEGGLFLSHAWSSGETGQMITVYQSGNYMVTVSNLSGCTGETDASVVFSAAPTAAISSLPYGCDGSITMVATGGNGFEWSNGETNDTVIVQNNGSYDVTVSDAAGCTDSVAEMVSIPPVPQVSILGNTALCSGEQGSLMASGSFQQYVWSGGETVDTIPISQPGNYTLTVTDNIGCTATNSLSVIALPTPDPTINGPAGFCEGSAATLTLNQSFPQMIWSNGDAAQSITISEPTVYAVTVTNPEGCTASNEWAVDEYSFPVVSINGPNSICSGSTATYSVTGSFSQINWSTGETSTSINLSSAGIYDVTVTNANGCTNSSSQELEISNFLSPNINQTMATCDGMVTLGTGSTYQTYLWSNGSTDPTIMVNADDTYSVTISDGTGCTGEDEIAVIVPPPPTVQITGLNAVCENETTTLTADAGFSNYQWSNGETTPSIEVSTPNAYSLIATDANGCTAIANLDFENIPLPDVNINGPISICNGSDVILSLVGNFTNINWSTGETTPQITLNQPGIYSVFATDPNGCSNTAEHTLGTGNWLTPTIQSSGSACDSLTTLDAGAGYGTYLWSNGETGQTNTVGGDGDYSVTVSSNAGCTGEASIDITLPVLPWVNISGPSAVCVGEMALLSADAGFVFYNWSQGATVADINVSQTGHYEITVTDGDGCTTVNGFDLENHLTPTVQITGPPAVCEGETAVLDAGSGFVNYEWSNGATSPTISVSQSDNYSLIVTDINSCTAGSNLDFEINPLPDVSINGPSFFCEGTPVSLSATGNFAQTVWNTGAVTPTIDVSQAGEYSVIVTDAIGCTNEAAHELESNGMLIPIINTSNSPCNPSAILDAGSGYDTYLWSTGATDESITIFTNGLYEVTVSDAAGCIGMATVQTTLPDLPVVNISGANHLLRWRSNDLGCGRKF